jgi:hypothetical protein
MSESISRGISVCHDCLVPNISQAPRFCKSIFDSSNQFVVFSMAFSLSYVGHEELLVIKKQYDCKSDLHTLQRS